MPESCSPAASRGPPRSCGLCFSFFPTNRRSSSRPGASRSWLSSRAAMLQASALAAPLAPPPALTGPDPPRRWPVSCPPTQARAASSRASQKPCPRASARWWLSARPQSATRPRRAPARGSFPPPLLSLQSPALRPKSLRPRPASSRYFRSGTFSATLRTSRALPPAPPPRRTPTLIAPPCLPAPL